MIHKYYIIIFLAGILSLQSAFGQDEKKVITDTMPTGFFEFDSGIEAPKKKKKEKKKVFYGLKCKRGYTRKGTGSKMVIESFFFLKHYKEPNPYVKKVYVYDVRKQQIVELTSINKKEVHFYKILHGPYKKMMGGVIVEQGIFYIGTKHGRWEKYGPEKKEIVDNGKDPKQEIVSQVLIDKEKYYKGWPKESQITFYDGAHTQIKEVKPYEHGELNGDYYYFKESGEILIYGKYVDGKKVGVWVEYNKNNGKKLRETKYPATPYVEQFEPIILTEWDEKGNIIIKDGKPFEPGKKTTDPLKEKFKRKK
ncbi:MAG: hypothetical protein K2X86_00390 [Cytophagaceae bacterium]|nr:hypothetical protein [Cytophagaceae bacterium]